MKLLSKHCDHNENKLSFNPLIDYPDFYPSYEKTFETRTNYLCASPANIDPWL